MARERRLRFQEVTLRRGKDGRFVRKGVRGARIERFTIERRTGRVVEIDARKTLLKTASVPDAGDDRGRINKALGRINVLAEKTHRGVKRIDITISGADRANKNRRVRLSMDTTGKVKGFLADAIVSRILWEMQHKGFRTNYPVTVIPSKRRPKRGLTKTAIMKLEPLKRVKITVLMKR